MKLKNRDRLVKDKVLLKKFIRNPFSVICGTNDWLCGWWYGDDCYYRSKRINGKSYPCKKNMVNKWLSLEVDDVEWNCMKNIALEEN